MRYLYSFEKFEKFIIESSESTLKAYKETEKDSKKFDIDWNDINVQKLICDELSKKIENSRERLDLKVDLKDIASKFEDDLNLSEISTKESKFFENNETQIDLRESLITLQQKLKESDISDFNEEVIIKKIEAQQLGENSEKKKSVGEENWLVSVKAAIKWLNENKFVKSSLKKIITVLDWILIVPKFIFGLLQSLFNWILRNIFGLSHESTSKTSMLLFPILSMCILIFLFLPLISTGILIFSGVGIIKAIAAFSIPNVASVGLILRGLFKIFRSWIGIYLLEPKSFRSRDKDDEEIFTFLEYLDNLERISGKKFRISLETRKAIEKLDTTIGIQRHGSAFGKKESKFDSKSISDFLKKDIKKVESITKEKGFDSVNIRFPVFNKIINNEKISKEDLKNLLDFFSKPDPDNRRYYRYTGGTIPKLEY